MTKPAPGPDQPPIPVRLVTFNTHHGVGEDDRHDLPRLAKLLASVDADVICLQEVDRRFGARSEDVDQAVLLSRALDMQLAWGPAIDRGEGRPGDEPVAVGEQGEIWARGPQVMAGYHDRPEETAAVLVDGWLRTGDIGVVGDDGQLAIVDRAKDMLLYKGYNVFPRELEEHLAAHAAVRHAAVVGLPDAAAGELPVAVLVLAADAGGADPARLVRQDRQGPRYRPGARGGAARVSPRRRTPAGGTRARGGGGVGARVHQRGPRRRAPEHRAASARQRRALSAAARASRRG